MKTDPQFVGTDISIDLETLSLDLDAAIVSIGAIVFDAATGITGEKRYMRIDLHDALRYGNVMGSTLKWWMGQSRAARDVFTDDSHAFMMIDALNGLSSMIDAHPIRRVWLNGPLEDGGWLKATYAAVGMRFPWRHTRSRDLRTLVELADIDLSEIPPVGTAHNALDDAIFQANVVSAAFQKINGAMAPLKGEEF